MMETPLVKELFEKFEAITIKVDDVECWSARQLQEILGYSKWDNFINVIEKAKTACIQSNNNVADHFADVGKMVDLGSGSQREIEDIALTRYGCYLIAQNGNPNKPEIAFAQTYFAVQTRNQEMIQSRLADIDRVKAREKLTETENTLSAIIYQRGVDSKGFGNIRSKGDQVLFGGFSTQKMKAHLRVPEGRPLADFLPTITIKAKDLATEMTNMNVVEKNLKGEPNITQEHAQNNQAVRNALGQRNIKPESLPAADDLQKVKRKLAGEDKKVLPPSKKSKGKKKNI